MDLIRSLVNKIRLSKKAKEEVENNTKPIEEEVNYLVFSAVDIKNRKATIFYKIKETKIKGKSVLVLAEKQSENIDQSFSEEILNRINKEKCVFNLDHVNKAVFVKKDCQCELSDFPIGTIISSLNPNTEELDSIKHKLKEDLCSHFEESVNVFLEIFND